MLDLRLSVLTPRVCLITQSDVKFNYFRKKTSPNEIVLAQETHSTRKCEVPWAHQWGRTNSIRFSHGTSASRGVFIAFREKLDYVILDEYSHDSGNFLILHAFKLFL